MTTPLHLDGVLAFPLTPFDVDGGIALDVLTDTVEAHLDGGAAALFVACGTGEFSSLTPAEVAAVLARTREIVAGRVPVWVGAGGGAATARAGIAAARDGGADGVLLLPPYLVSGPPEGLHRYVEYAVADTGIPVIVYHRSPGVFTAEGARRLLDVDQVVGLKDGYGDVELMSRIVSTIRAVGTDRARDFLFFNGLPTAEVSARAYAAIGVARYSSAVHCIAPEIAARFNAALAAGDDAVMDRLLEGFYLPLVALRDETPGFAVALVKAAARLKGQKVGPVRPPLVEPSDEQVERLAGIVDRGRELVVELSR
ncbi:5-dehydro-4-deoxyglucarate dehydratase [Pseudonocardia sp. HH130630-07]|uniref:5-dehydro-4-deoxyglucarate dehydratase n=1 Tax=Pseudonocardia sp. HH130630-07 TaxID=1690815 RepID=UPI000814CD75|nr:5-dehydro-4-deoxyglucarate dehydratase [Pseudonocardia sp. HH130630-07]ANY08337.1 5-dehydro-4-deoxyglucarate dehydratase [Pseudonocardia sp. HH130630-07]